MRADVAIVGGGLAGLAAGRRLHHAGIDFVLLEARERLGGRILSVGADGVPADDGFDLGASWFWPAMQPALASLAHDLGLAVFAQHVDGHWLIERTRSAPPLRYPSMRQEPASMRIAGGTGALTDALARSLPPDRVHPGTPVARVVLEDAAVTLSGADGSPLLEARQVILAAPPRLLSATLSFDPPLDPATIARSRGTPTWMAPHAKFFALYDRPFWRDAGLSGAAQSALGPMTETHDATSASGAAALFGFLGVASDQRRAIGEAAMVEACVAQFRRLFGPPAASPLATLFKDWAADSLTATADDRITTGHPVPGSLQWIDGAWAGRLSLAGSETSDTEPGYLAGAVQAGERAVAERLRALRARTAIHTARQSTGWES